MGDGQLVGGYDSVVSSVRFFSWQSGNGLLHDWGFFNQHVVQSETHLSETREVGEVLGSWDKDGSERRVENELGLLLNQGEGGHGFFCYQEDHSICMKKKKHLVFYWLSLKAIRAPPNCLRQIFM